MNRLLTTLLILLTGFAVGCGLSERERAVSDANRANDAVYEASRLVAQRVAELPDTDPDRQALRPLRHALQGYVEAVERYNEALRLVTLHLPALDAHYSSSFLPASENALSACEDALQAFDAETVETEAVQRAIARVGLCMDRYATAVTRMSNAYQRLER